jgi:hypothetical protein
MSRTRSLTELKLPARMTSPVRSAKKRSTKLSQDDEVGVKCILKRGRFSSHARTFGCFMCCTVIGDQMQIEIVRRLTVNLLEKAQPLDVGVAGLGAADQFAGQLIKRGKQGDRAMPYIVMRHRAWSFRRQRQAELRAFKRLALALLVAARHQRLRRRVEISPITSQNFSSNFGSLDSLKVRVMCGFRSFFTQMRCTVLCDMPAWRAILRTLQRRRPLGGRVASEMTRATLFSGSEGLRPRPTLSVRPARPDRSKRDDQIETVRVDVFIRAATSLILTPFRRSRMIPARKRSRCSLACPLARRRNSALTSSLADRTSTGRAMNSYPRDHTATVIPQYLRDRTLDSC